MGDRGMRNMDIKEKRRKMKENREEVNGAGEKKQEVERIRGKGKEEKWKQRVKRIKMMEASKL